MLKILTEAQIWVTILLNQVMKFMTWDQFMRVLVIHWRGFCLTKCDEKLLWWRTIKKVKVVWLIGKRLCVYTAAGKDILSQLHCFISDRVKMSGRENKVSQRKAATAHFFWHPVKFVRDTRVTPDCLHIHYFFDCCASGAIPPVFFPLSAQMNNKRPSPIFPLSPSPFWAHTSFSRWHPEKLYKPRIRERGSNWYHLTLFSSGHNSKALYELFKLEWLWLKRIVPKCSLQSCLLSTHRMNQGLIVVAACARERV